MEVDTEDRHMFTHSCSFDHVIWTIRTGYDCLSRKIGEMSTPYRRDVKKFDELLVWRDGNFFRPKFKQAKNGLYADQVWWDNDTKGVSFPTELEDPERLEDLVQAKANREFAITNWLETYERKEEFPIWPEEYLSSPGMNVELFRKLFHRDPNPEIVSALHDAKTNSEL